LYFPDTELQETHPFAKTWTMRVKHPWLGSNQYRAPQCRWPVV